MIGTSQAWVQKQSCIDANVIPALQKTVSLRSMYKIVKLFKLQKIFNLQQFNIE